MAYVNENEFKLLLSPEIYNRIFGNGSDTGFGGISATSGSLRFEQFAEQASGYVDSFLSVQGVEVPVSNPTPFIKRCALYRCYLDVMAFMNIQVSDDIRETAARNESILYDIAIGKISPPGTSTPIDAGVGGNSFSPITGSLGGQLSKSKLSGRFF